MASYLNNSTAHAAAFLSLCRVFPVRSQTSTPLLLSEILSHDSVSLWLASSIMGFAVGTCDNLIFGGIFMVTLWSRLTIQGHNYKVNFSPGTYEEINGDIVSLFWHLKYAGLFFPEMMTTLSQLIFLSAQIWRWKKKKCQKITENSFSFSLLLPSIRIGPDSFLILIRGCINTLNFAIKKTSRCQNDQIYTNQAQRQWHLKPHLHTIIRKLKKITRCIGEMPFSHTVMAIF